MDNKEIKEVKTRYYTILTKKGKIAVSNAIAMNEKVDFSYIALGDGGGKEYEPTEEQTELKGKKTENIKIHNIIVIEENSQIELQAIIGASVGGFTIREAGIYDSKGNLLAISKIAERTKPSLSEGSGIDMFFKLRLEVSNTSIVNITVDPSALLVNINQFNQFKGEMNKEFEKFKDEVNQALAGGELEEVIISIKDDLDKHIEDSITNSDIHGMTLVDEELYRKTGKDSIPIKLDKKNIKGKLDISEITGKATIDEAIEGTNDTKYMTPKKVKDFMLGFGDGRYYIFDNGIIEGYPEESLESSIWGKVGFSGNSVRLSVSSDDKSAVFSINKNVPIEDYNYVVIEGFSYDDNRVSAKFGVSDTYDLKYEDMNASASLYSLGDVRKTVVLGVRNINKPQYIKFHVSSRISDKGIRFNRLYLTNKHPFDEEGFDGNRTYISRD